LAKIKPDSSGQIERRCGSYHVGAGVVHHGRRSAQRDRLDAIESHFRSVQAEPHRPELPKRDDEVRQMVDGAADHDEIEDEKSAGE
jgi:hypothetical protein